MYPTINISQQAAAEDSAICRPWVTFKTNLLNYLQDPFKQGLSLLEQCHSTDGRYWHIVIVKDCYSHSVNRSYTLIVAVKYHHLL